MNIACTGFTLWLTAVSMLGLSFPAYSSAQDYYKGKTIRFIVAFRPGGTLRQMHAITATRCFEDLLGQVRAPTQIIHGTDDVLLRPACGQRSARAIPGARLELIPGMGHDSPNALMPRWATLMAANAGRS